MCSKHCNNLVSNLLSLSLGIKGIPVTILNSKSSVLPFIDDLDTKNIFDIQVTVAGIEKTWQVIFDPSDISSAPDIVFDDESFFPDITKFESFQSWNRKSADSLSKIVVDLYHAYMRHQLEVLTEYHQLKDEVEELFCTPSYSDICEVSIQKNGPGTYNDTIRIIIPLRIDCSNLPPYLAEGNPGNDGCCLTVTFDKPNLSLIKTTLELSPRLERALGDSSNLRIPVYTPSSLIKYVNKVQDLLTNTISFVCEKYQKRKSLILNFLGALYGSIIEYDMDNFSEAVFLLDHEGFHVLLYVVLSEQYPVKEPQLYFQSIYYLSNAKKTSDTYRHSLSQYAYDPKSSDTEKREIMLSCVRDNVGAFRSMVLRNS